MLIKERADEQVAFGPHLVNIVLLTKYSSSREIPLMFKTTGGKQAKEAKIRSIELKFNLSHS